jgi:hypothetical protein
MIEVEKTVEDVGHLINPNFRGEAILTVGLALREILNRSCGVIAIGPFGCMPSRVAEAMLNKEMNVTGKGRVPGWRKRAQPYDDLGELPFYSIETDGMPFPQIIEANLEAFILQARRVHERIMSIGDGHASRRFPGYQPAARICRVVSRQVRGVFEKT